MDTLYEKISKFLNKVGTVLVDRRAWAAGLIIALLALLQMFNVPNAGVLGDNLNTIYGSLLVIVPEVFKIVAAVYTIAKLIESWTERPPSGLDYKAPKIEG